MGVEHLDTLDDIVVRRIRGKFDTALSKSDTLRCHPFSKERSHQMHESHRKGGVKSKETPCLTDPTTTLPVQQFFILHPLGLRRIRLEHQTPAWA